ncbi:MAG TPA: FecR domain-containing protein [Chryseosolibacter sp.]|nr:FecR domain-containing protein [Chryseosolibacter sp.]
MEKDDYIKKWLDGTLTEEEKSFFETTEEYQRLEKLSRSLMSFKAPDYAVAAEYERMKERRALRNKVVHMNWLSPLLKVAAVLIAVGGAWFFFLSDKPTVVETLAAEKSTLWLPDSSFVALNAMSKVTFDETKWDRQRKVELEGEAFFKVARGSRFDVVTSMGTVSVLGTAFNVRNRQDYFEVICYEGSVEVTSAEVVRLSPQQTFRLVNGVVAKGEAADSQSMPDWRNGESSFRSVPFRYVVEEFERQFNVSVTTRNVDRQRLFTGTFTHSDFSVALQSIALPFNLAYEVDGKKIILTGEN